MGLEATFLTHECREESCRDPVLGSRLFNFRTKSFWVRGSPCSSATWVRPTTLELEGVPPEDPMGVLEVTGLVKHMCARTQNVSMFFLSNSFSMPRGSDASAGKLPFGFFLEPELRKLDSALNVFVCEHGIKGMGRQRVGCPQGRNQMSVLNWVGFPNSVECQKLSLIHI